MALILTSTATAASTEETYVWQRDFNPAVKAAVTRGADLLDSFHFLAAEVSWAGNEPKTWRAPRDWPALAALRKPIGLVLRIGSFDGPFAADDKTARSLAQVAADLLSDARAGGIEPTELQIDFDCAESKLDGYRAWLAALRVVTERAPLTITVLPSWMNARDAFSRLVAATDGFVLQVHSLARPRGPDEPYVLCDPAGALAWAAQAGSFGTPFRIALPTYGYLLNFDAAGVFVSLSAEQQARPPSPDGRRRVVMSDPVVLAELARELRARPPDHCDGLIWFRLPVDGDQLNWAWSTFARVVRGEPLTTRVVAAAEWTEPALAEIVMINDGHTTEIVRPSIAVKWGKSARLLAADALGGFRLETFAARREATVVRDPMAAEILLIPGERRRMAWFRFADATAVDVQLLSSR